MTRSLHVWCLGLAIALSGSGAMAADRTEPALRFNAHPPPSISSDKNFVYVMTNRMIAQIDLEADAISLFTHPCKGKGLRFPTALPRSHKVLTIAGERGSNVQWFSLLDSRTGQVERLGMPYGTSFRWLTVSPDGSHMIYSAGKRGDAQMTRLFQVDLERKVAEALSPIRGRCQTGEDCPVLPIRLARSEPSYRDAQHVTFRAATNEREDSLISKHCSSDIAGNFSRTTRFRALLFQLDMQSRAADVHELNCRAVSETLEHQEGPTSQSSVGIEHHVNGVDGTLYFTVTPRRRGQKRYIYAFRQGRIEPVLQADDLMGPFSVSSDGKLFAHLSGDRSVQDNSGVRLRVAEIGSGSERFFGLREISQGTNRTADCRAP